MGFKNVIKFAFAFSPIGAPYRLFQIAKEHEESRGHVSETIIGSEPYYPPEDNGIPWTRQSNDQYGNTVYSRPYVPRGSEIPPEAYIMQWCGRCGCYTDYETGMCSVCGR